MFIIARLFLKIAILQSNSKGSEANNLCKQINDHNKSMETSEDRVKGLL